MAAPTETEGFSAQPPNDPEKKIAGMHRSTAILGLITALVGLAAVVAGLFAGHTASQNNGLSSSLSSAQATNSTLSRQLSSAAAAESSLSDANASLQAQLDAGQTSVPPGPSGSLNPAPVTVRHKADSIIMHTTAQGGNYLDLDAPASDVQWTGSSENFSWGGNFFDYGAGARALIVGDKAPTYNSCRTQTGWATPALNIQTLMVNDYFCFQTPGKRYAIIKVLQMTGPQAIVSVVVYDPPEK